LKIGTLVQIMTKNQALFYRHNVHTFTVQDCHN